MLDRIDRRMPEFNEMSPSARRVAIARDVLMQLDARQLCARTGEYVSLVRAGESVSTTGHGEGLDPFPRADEDRCYVCALGAMAVSVFDGDAVAIGARASTRGLPRRIHTALGEYFEALQLELIEAAFEGWEETGWEFSAANSLSPEDCLRGIMENIVENDGRFVPSRLVWAERLYDDCDEDPPPANGGSL